MKHVQWLTIIAARADDYIHVSVEGLAAEQEYIVDWVHATEDQTYIRVGTLVEPSLKMAQRDFRDAVRREIAEPILAWFTRLVDRIQYGRVYNSMRARGKR